VDIGNERDWAPLGTTHSFIMNLDVVPTLATLKPVWLGIERGRTATNIAYSTDQTRCFKSRFLIVHGSDAYYEVDESDRSAYIMGYLWDELRSGVIRYYTEIS
jgi:hypothetical protein